jgi:dCTP deaminase
MAQGGVFSDRDIIEALERGQIVIDPFTPANVKGSSVDVCVGEWFFRTEGRSLGGVYNPLDESNVAKYFGEPVQADIHEEYVDSNGLKPFKNIPLRNRIIILEAGQRILGHTQEFIGVLGNATTMMKARSSTGRNGFSVCHDAGWGDPGYVNRWTMEIQNINTRHAMVLPVGLRVAQLVFFHTGAVDQPYRSKYQDVDMEMDPAQILEAVKAAWQPSDLLPKTYRDAVPEAPED